MAEGFEIETPCECQGILGATLNAERLVVDGWVRRFGDRERAPANTIGHDPSRFDVAWHCPLCGRNTLRTFHCDTLRPVHLPDPEAPPKDAADAP